jgi:hypothetical protein
MRRISDLGCTDHPRALAPADEQHKRGDGADTVRVAVSGSRSVLSFTTVRPRTENFRMIWSYSRWALRLPGG